MVFNSLVYAAYLPLVVLIYLRLSQRAQNRFLLAASYLFYGWWDWRFLSLLGLSTVVDFNVARRIPGSPRAKRWLQLSLLTNLGVLATFKYFDFFAGTFEEAAAVVGWNPGDLTLELVLPVGISFYTFQTLAYTLDVYRGKMKPTDDLWDFALYVSFFPQLVAGPIERAETLLPQLQQKRTVTSEDVRVGFTLILLGLVRKVGIADAVAGEVDRAFDHPMTMSRTQLWMALYLFAFQIYGDFSGYSSMARGSARLLGIRLMRNFDQPYLASSITDFWRRWHRSLSFWLRDYVYISLGGNRGGTLRTYRNLMLTMLLGGLWHGASWTFVIWGGLHGAGLAVHKMWKGEARKDTPSGPLATAFGIALTFHLVVFGWMFFRARTLADVWDYWSALGHAVWFTGLEWDLAWRVLLYGSLLLFLDVVQARARSHTPMLAWSYPARVLAIAFALIWLLVFGGIDVDVAFLYFQF